jgi:hypothetical protein
VPPPATTFAVHFTIGGTPSMTAAETIVPATKAAGGRQGVEQIIQDCDVIGQDFHDRRHAQHRQRRRGTSQAKIAA